MAHAPVELSNAVRKQVATGGQPLARVAQQVGTLRLRCLGPDRLIEAFECAGELCMQTLQLKERLGERLEPSRLDE